MARRGSSSKTATRAEVYRRVVLGAEVIDVVAEDVGVSRRTVYRWLKARDRLKADFETDRRVKEEASRTPPPGTRSTQPDGETKTQGRRRGRPKGRPLIERPEVLDPILDLLRRGHSKRKACVAGGVTEKTLAQWEQKGEAGVEPYASHLAEIHMALAEGAIELERRIIMGEPGWQGAAWLLERTRRETYGKHDQVTVHREDPLEEVDDGELDRLIAEAEAEEA
jgi:transcriptional regulator with XRE-family HTH domain